MPVPVVSAAAAADDETDRSVDTSQPWACLDFAEGPFPYHAE